MRRLLTPTSVRDPWQEPGARDEPGPGNNLTRAKQEPPRTINGHFDLVL